MDSTEQSVESRSKSGGHRRCLVTLLLLAALIATAVGLLNSVGGYRLPPAVMLRLHQLPTGGLDAVPSADEEDGVRTLPPRSNSSSTHQQRDVAVNHALKSKSTSQLKPNTHQQKKQQKKCVVFVSLHSHDRAQSLPEWNNLAHFLSHGYIPPDTPTAMFDSVEFLFLAHIDSLESAAWDRIVREELVMRNSGGGGGGDGGRHTSNGDSTEQTSGPLSRPRYYNVPNVSNARIVVTPRAAADLNMVQHVFPEVARQGDDSTRSIVRFISLNTGARGPLLPPADVMDGGAMRSVNRSTDSDDDTNGDDANGKGAHYYWVDIVGGARLVEHMGRVGFPPASVEYAKKSVEMGSTRTLIHEDGVVSSDNAGASDDFSNLVVGVLFSKEIRLHLQSYFLSLPPPAASVYFGNLLNYSDKGDFINHVEVACPQQLHSQGFSLFATGQGYSYDAASTLIRDGATSPLITASCPLCGVFTKYGGNLWKDETYQNIRFIEQTERITVAMARNARARLLVAGRSVAFREPADGSDEPSLSADTIPHLSPALSSAARAVPSSRTMAKNKYAVSLAQNAAVLEIERALRLVWSSKASATHYERPSAVIEALRRRESEKLAQQRPPRRSFHRR